MNVAELLSRHGRYLPDKLALVFEDQRLTYSQYNAEVNCLAHGLMALGIKKGDKVATLLPNRQETLEAYWAITKIGAVLVPMSTLLLGSGLKTLLNDSDAVAVITSSGFLGHLAEIMPDLLAIAPERVLLVDGPQEGYADYHAIKAAASDQDPEGIQVDPDDMFNIIYSSGTTGQPKGIVHTHHIRSMYCTLTAAGFRMNPESVVLHTGSLVFNGAFAFLLPCLYVGGVYVLHAMFEPEAFIEAVAEHKVTHVIMVPSQVVAVLHSPAFAPEKFASLECICSVGAPLLADTKEELKRQLPGVVYELYGLTEGFPTILDKTDFDHKTGSVGVPPPFYEMRIEDDDRQEVPTGEVGEIVGKGPIMMPGYYKRPDLTAEAIKDGWLYTGDMGYVDEDGYLYLVDRKKDMIISGGVNVYPKDIEEVVACHPAVMECAVYGVDSPKWGETPIAAVLLAPGAEADPEEMKAWINQNISAKFQRVSQVVIMDDFPRNVAGKTLKREMREEFIASGQAEGL